MKSASKKLRKEFVRPMAVSILTVGVFGSVLICIPLFTAHAQTQRIENNVAVFAALDKVTAKIKKLEIPINEAVNFGSLTLIPRVCFSRPPTERPKTTTFVEIDEKNLAGETKRLFSGWMFAESPGLSAVEHPVFDVWLTECKGPKTPPARQERVNNEEIGGWQVEEPPVERQRPRRRRIRR